MAIAGSMTSAYYMRLVGGTLDIQKTTYPLHLCDKPTDAAAKIRAGGTAIVSGHDAFAVRLLVTTNEAGQ